MSKIIIKSKISSSNFNMTTTNCFGIKKDDKITYKDKDCMVNITLTKNSIFINRENEEKKIKLKFEAGNKCAGNYIIKDLNIKIDVFTITKDIKIGKNKLFIEYELYVKDEFSDVFIYTIEWSDL